VLLLQVLLSAPPPDPDASTRMDLTHLTVYTVDDASTTEVDDGLSITTDEAGAKLLWVHVADPTRWLTPGVHIATCRTEQGQFTQSLPDAVNTADNVLLGQLSCICSYVYMHRQPGTCGTLAGSLLKRMLAGCCPGLGDMLDAEARSRSRSLYFPWGAVPMFPRSLAEGPFSLGSSSSKDGQQQPQQQECCAFSVCASLNEDGSLGQLTSLGPSTIRVQHRLTYDEVSMAGITAAARSCAIQQQRSLDVREHGVYACKGDAAIVRDGTMLLICLSTCTVKATVQLLPYRATVLEATLGWLC
jgi:hypothetical protein